MSYRYVKVDREGPLTIVTIDRAEAHNALNLDANRELEAVFDAFAGDDDQWVAIITGAGGKAFCAGLDLRERADGAALVLPDAGFAGLSHRFDLAKPVIAAVNGIAMGGGFELALACDIVVAAEAALFALPEPRVGLAALAGGIQRLPREIGLKRAMGMMLTGRRLSAREGFELGFVNEVAEDDVMVAARRWAQEILACSPMSVRATKEAALAGLTVSTREALAAEWDYPAMKAMLASQDAIEGPAAFAAKRAPNWTGK